tara:strand:- start:3 stop:425 length:423 start_codon:yes stop_codon:yes gene_type:complete
MANVGVGAVRIIDGDGDVVESDGSGRLKVETEQDDAFGTFVTYADVGVTASASNLNTLLSLTGGDVITDAKEILIQTDDANTGFIMVGSSSSTDAASSVGSRHGIKLNGGETLVLAIAAFASIFLEANTGTQYVNLAYFK